MRLYELFADKNYHTSIATTFGIDFDAYESIALSRLRGAGCRNNLVVADGRMLTHALSGASALPRRAGAFYTINGAKTAGVFHPKLFLQLGRRGGRLIIGSANMTPSGLAGNLEIIGTLSCGEEDSGEQQLIGQALNFAVGFADGEQQAVNDQIAWMRARTGWLEGVLPTNGPVELSDGTRAALILSEKAQGIGQRFAAQIDEPVTRLIVISPYWDPELAALQYLAEQLNPERVAVIVDPQSREFPRAAAHAIENLTLYNRGSFREGRFIHAKAFIAQTSSADHILFGSANCTNAALGGADFAGSNAEACLYRKLPKGTFADVLGLSDILIDDQIISPDELAEPEYVDDLPLFELAEKHPGTFEGRADSLTWHYKSVQKPKDCSIKLLGSNGQMIKATLKPLKDGSKTSLCYQIENCELPPVFAKVTFANGTSSPPAIIAWSDKLKLEMRERLRSGTQSRLDELESDTEASLALLDFMNELRALDQNESTFKAPIAIPKADTADVETSSDNHKSLSYEEFIAGRRPRTSGHELTYNSLAGSEVSIVRGILNRIIGLGSVSQSQSKEDDDHEGVFDLGDETDDAENALSAGAEFGDKTQDQEVAEKEAYIRKVQRRRATQDQLIKAVESFQKDIKERESSGGALTSFDLIRLRALIMILARAASPHAANSEEIKESGSSLRVLPIEGDQNSWPVVIGRLLFTFFGGKNPAIQLLYLKNEHDQVPGDFNECWATCYWAFQICLHAPMTERERQRVERLIKPLARQALSLTLPSREELLANDIISIIECLNNKYAEQIGIKSSEVKNGHGDLIDEFFKPETR